MEYTSDAAPVGKPPSCADGSILLDLDEELSPQQQTLDYSSSIRGTSWSVFPD